MIERVNLDYVVFSITNQSAVEIGGRYIFTNAVFTTGIIQGTRNDRVKDFLFLKTKKRESRNYEDSKPMEIDKEFIDNNTFEEDVNFYRTIDCKKSRLTVHKLVN